MEHPAPPADPLKASIWRLPLMLYLLEWPEFQFLEISQGLWGRAISQTHGTSTFEPREDDPCTAQLAAHAGHAEGH